MGTAVAKQKDQLPAEFMDAMFEDQASGMEEMGQDDFQLPIIKIIHPQSPELDEDDAAYIANGKPGMFFNSVTRELWSSEGFRVIPCHFERAWLEWRPKKMGGGLRGAYRTEAEGLANREDPEHEITETLNYYVLIEGTDGVWMPAMIPMKKGAIPLAKRWNGMAKLRQITNSKGQTAQAPLYSSIYQMSSAKKPHPEGAYWTFDVKPTGLWVHEEDGGIELYGEAKSFQLSRAEISRQRAERGPNGNIPEADYDVVEGDGAQTVNGEDDLPF